MSSEHRRRPPRLAEVFHTHVSPVYLVTFCAMYRRPILSRHTVHAAFQEYAERGATEKAVAVGRYVIMPDHVHLFVCGGDNFDLGFWVRGLKRAMAKAVVVAAVPAAENDTAPVTGATTPERIWQPGFFDHLLRSSESYAEKWNYVRENPVRAGLVQLAEDWPYQGEIVLIDRV